jgi:phosphoglycolate phosphatase
VRRQGQRLVAIDLDGTLVDSAPDIAHCLGHALVALGYAAPGEARTRAWIGDGLEILIARAIAHAAGAQAVSKQTVEAHHKAALGAFLACYSDNLFVRSRLYPGVAATLDALLASGLRLCCITNKRLAFSEPLLTQAGIRERFELLLGGDSLPEKKPSALPLKVAAQQLGIAPADATLVGDSHQDLRAARAAGYGFVLASYGYGKVDETELGAAPRISRFTELTNAIGSTGSTGSTS